MAKTKEKNGWAVLPYWTERFGRDYLVSNILGSWDMIGRNDFIKLDSGALEPGSVLFERLLKRGVIANEKNIKGLIEDYRKLNSNLFCDISLHIVVVTTRCNMNCLYCQTGDRKPLDMDFEVASRILKYVFDTQNRCANIEFQGGEPLLNWKMVKFIAENSRKINAGNKDLNLSLVTNGALLDGKKLSFLCENQVDICFSFDGPRPIHDSNRVCGKISSHAAVKKAIDMTKAAYKKHGIKREVNMLCTLTRKSLFNPKEIIDEYLKIGAEKIALRPLSRLGMAATQWDDIGYSPEEFNDFWAKAMDYIIDLNKKGHRIQERLASVILTKIFKKENPGYVDMMSPCGAGRSVLAYTPEGDIYPCDEARMIKEDIFKLGNVLKDDYKDVLKDDNIFCLCEASLIDLWDYRSAFQPWLGTCPVMNYAQGGTLVPKITTTPLHKNFSFQIRYIFDKILNDARAKEIFLSWIR